MARTADSSSNLQRETSPEGARPATTGGHATDPQRAAHTAEHILSAVMHRDFGSGRSLETHFGPKKSKCDYHVDRPLGTEDFERIAGAVNAAIQSDLPVTSFVVPRVEAEARYDMSKVPAEAETIRIVRIGGLDVMPCVGEHVERTSQLGRFEIASAEMTDAHRVRIRFRLRNAQS